MSWRELSISQPNCIQTTSSTWRNLKEKDWESMEHLVKRVRSSSHNNRMVHTFWAPRSSLSTTFTCKATSKAGSVTLNNILDQLVSGTLIQFLGKKVTSSWPLRRILTLTSTKCKILWAQWPVWRQSLKTMASSSLRLLPVEFPLEPTLLVKPVIWWHRRSSAKQRFK